jgi:UDP-3-O-[3-hydroxymyristoyl] glucosamine N-acyltransferase
MQRTAAELADILQGRVEGDPNVSVSRLAKIEDGGPGELTFLSNPDYEGFLYNTQASVAIVGHSFVPARKLPDTLTLLRVADPYAAFARLLEAVAEASQKPHGIHATAVIADDVSIPENCYIGPYVIIESGARIGAEAEVHAHAIIGKGASIGARCLLHAHVQVLENCIIGEDCVLHPNVVIGSDGFGFAPQADASYRKIPQTGNVILDRGCEIGAGTTIDRATLGSTRIGEGVKLDNLIQVAHNVSIGKHTVIAAQCGIARSTTIGERCMIGGQVGIAGHLKIADG